MAIGNALNINFGINQLLWANSATTLAGLSTANNEVLITSAGGVPSFSATLPAGVTANITSVGTITSGTWNASLITGAFGGTGVNNGASTITIGGNLAFSGAHTFVGTLTGNTTVTFPTSGTLATTAGTINSITGTALQIDVTAGVNPVISIDSGYIGQTSITTLGTITTGTWTGTNIALNHGGTNAALTASNGGIFYSTATAGAILAGTATANQVLLSGSSATPAWSTATYPATSTINQLLYSSSNNVIAGLTTANSGVLVTSAGGVPSISTTLPASLTITTPNIVGVTNASNASAGSVGEFISSVIANGASINLSNGVAANVTSISLTAGDWDVHGNVYFTGSTLNLIASAGWISSTSATQPDASLLTTIVGLYPSTPICAQVGASVPYVRINVSTTTTIYLSVNALFVTGTATACGGIFARRVR